MRILDELPSPAPEDSAALAAIAAHAATRDWKAAAWLLEHHPTHRRRWGNQEQIASAIHQAMAIVAKVIGQATWLTPDQQARLALELQATGLPHLPDSEPEALQ